MTGATLITMLVIVVVTLGTLVVLGGLLWLGGWAIDACIKEYIDYAKKGR